MAHCFYPSSQVCGLEMAEEVGGCDDGRLFLTGYNPFVRESACGHAVGLLSLVPELTRGDLDPALSLLFCFPIFRSTASSVTLHSECCQTLKWPSCKGFVNLNIFSLCLALSTHMMTVRGSLILWPFLHHHPVCPSLCSPSTPDSSLQHTRYQCLKLPPFYLIVASSS